MTNADSGQTSDIHPYVNQKGDITLVAGKLVGAGATDGSVGNAHVNDPHGLAVDATGNVYVIDLDDVEAAGITAMGRRNIGVGSVRKISPEGLVTTLARDVWVSGRYSGGCTVDFVGGRRGFQWSQRGLAVDRKGSLYFGDLVNGVIRKIDASGAATVLTTSFGNYTAAVHFEFPDGVAVDASDNVYVADRVAHTITKITPSGEVMLLAGTAGARGFKDGVGASASFNGPDGLAVDGAGNVYVADAGNGAIRKVSATGAVTTLARRFAMPLSVAVDGNGNVYVADAVKDEVSKIGPSGEITTVRGIGEPAGNALADMPGRNFWPVSVTTDSDGFLFVSSQKGVFKIRMP